jgi:hypothetical protein
MQIETTRLQLMVQTSYHTMANIKKEQNFIRGQYLKRIMLENYNVSKLYHHIVRELSPRPPHVSKSYN